MLGAFELAPPAPATVGDTVGLVTKVIAGGPLVAEVSSGRCQMMGVLTVQTEAVGECTIVVTQVETEGFLPAKGQIVSITVNAAPLNPPGSFTATATAEVVVGDEIEVISTVISGGSLAIKSLTGTCQGGGSLFTAVAAGECLLQVSQRPTARHRPGSAVVLTVTVVEPPLASVMLQAPPSAHTESTFEVTVDMIGARRSPNITLSGSCQLTVELASTIVETPNTSIQVLADDKTGSCRISATIEPADGYGPAEPASVDVEIIKRQGSFHVSHPTQIEVGETFQIDTIAESGGDVTIDSTSDSCRTEVSSSVFIGVVTGTCTFTATQDETDGVAAGEPQHFSVEVVKKVYVIALDAPSSVEVGESFDVGIVYPLDAPYEVLDAFSLSWTGPCDEDYYGDYYHDGGFYGWEAGSCVFVISGDVETDTYRTETGSATVTIKDRPVETTRPPPTVTIPDTTLPPPTVTIPDTTLPPPTITIPDTLPPPPNSCVISC